MVGNQSCRASQSFQMATPFSQLHAKRRRPFPISYRAARNDPNLPLRRTTARRPKAVAHAAYCCYSSAPFRLHGYLPKNATNKNMNPAKKLAKKIKSSLIPSVCEALKAIAVNPSIPITPLTTRMNGEIFSCWLIAYAHFCKRPEPDIIRFGKSP